MNLQEANALRDIMRRVQNNTPRHNDPDAFHEEKSEIVRDLGRLAVGQIPVAKPGGR